MKPEAIIRFQAFRCLTLLGTQSLFELDDLVQEGYFCLQRAKEKWNPDGSACFNTYFTKALMNHYGAIVRTKHEQILPNNELEIDKEVAGNTSCVRVGKDGELHYQFRSMDLSKRAQRFLALVFRPPPELRKLIRSSTKRKLANIVGESMGWNAKELKEIKQELFAKVFC